MHADLVFEALRFLERNDLEICQLSAMFFDVFIASSTKLPLRCIDLASIKGRSVQLTKRMMLATMMTTRKRTSDSQRTITKTYVTADGFDEFVAYLRNVCIELLALGFTQDDVPVVRYWLASHSSDNFCLMEICQEPLGASTDYELFDDALRALKPNRYSVELYGGNGRQQYLRQSAQLTHVFGRESLLRSPVCLKVEICEGDIPAALVTAWLSSSWYACDLECQNGSPSSWVDELIESFVNGSFAQQGTAM